MRQLILIPALVCSTLLLTGALDRRLLFTDADSPAFNPLALEAPAGKLLDDAVTRLSPERVRWLETTVCQQTFGEDAYKAQGRFLLGTDARMRLNMKVFVEGTTYHVMAMSDGRELRQARWLEGQTPQVECFALPKQEGGDTSAARENFLSTHACAGPLPLLRNIRQGLREPKQQVGLWHDRRVIRLSGAWNADEPLLKTLPASLRARRCALFLDEHSLWPYCIEWIGSPRPQDHAVVLLRLEFREPVLNRAPLDQECARFFQFSAE
jgi:hypothetical protein